MKRLLRFFATAAVVVTVSTWATSKAQETRIPVNSPVTNTVHPPKVKQGVLVVPHSSIAQTPPAGHRFVAHTNVRFLIPGGFTPDETPPFTGYAYETPESLACVYGLVSSSSGCNPNLTTAVPTGGSQSIAIVDAYDDPEAAGDLAWFGVQFGVPLKSPEQFQVVWATNTSTSCTGVPVDPTGGWELEESLDIEYAHAMAPNATIYLVEACSNFDSDLQQAVLMAANLVHCGSTSTCPIGSTGKGEISMSWGGGEYSGETASNSCAFLDDSCFTAANIVYVASSGDAPGTEYPGVSPNVVSAGGLSTRRSPYSGNLIGLAGWVDAGGGISFYEPRPSYQSTISTIVGTGRGVPDVAADADPNTGVWVYDTFPTEGFEYFTWWIVGGTSVAAPTITGIINRAGAFAASTNAELTTMYGNKGNASDFTDITTAFCGPYMGYTAGTGWDFCSGIGAIKGYSGK